MAASKAPSFRSIASDEWMLAVARRLGALVEAIDPPPSYRDNGGGADAPNNKNGLPVVCLIKYATSVTSIRKLSSPRIAGASKERITKVNRKILVGVLSWALAVAACDSGGDEDDGGNGGAGGGSRGDQGGGAGTGKGGSQGEGQGGSGMGGAGGGAGAAGKGAGGGAGAGTSANAAAGNYNNQSTITGPTIGGTSSFAQSRKMITATLTKPSDDFEVGTAYATKLSTAAQLIVEVTNKGQKFHCFVKAEVVRLKDSSGTMLGSDSGAFISGSLGKSVAVWTDTCLGPGEKGYLLGLKADLAGGKDYFAGAHAVELELEAESFEMERPDVRIVGESYTVGQRDVLARQPVTITIKNEGKQTIKIKNLGSYSTVLALDGGGTPVGFGYVDEGVSNELVATGQTTRLQGNLSFEGAAAKLLVFVDADDPGSRFIARPGVGDEAHDLSDMQAAQARWRAATEGMRATWTMLSARDPSM